MAAVSTDPCCTPAILAQHGGRDARLAGSQRFALADISPAAESGAAFPAAMEWRHSPPM